VFDRHPCQQLSITLGLLFCLTSTSIAKPIDCKKASSQAEHMICQSPSLMELDNDLNINLEVTADSDIGSGARSHMRRSQKIWLATRNQCKDEACIAKAYRARIEAICTIPVLTGVRPTCRSFD
jgi:uncharacterized protein